MLYTTVTVKYQPDLDCSSLLHPPNLILNHKLPCANCLAMFVSLPNLHSYLCEMKTADST